MNSIMNNYFPIFQVYLKLRDDLMEMLVDEDLSFPAYGGDPPLGALCREIGEVEHAYIQSFRTFTRFLISGDRGKTRTIFFAVLGFKFLYF